MVATAFDRKSLIVSFLLRVFGVVVVVQRLSSVASGAHTVWQVRLVGGGMKALKVVHLNQIRQIQREVRLVLDSVASTTIRRLYLS